MLALELLVRVPDSIGEKMKFDFLKLKAAAAVSSLVAALLTGGCESIALLPRQSIEGSLNRGDIDQRDRQRGSVDRQPESRTDLPRDRAGDEVTGTVQKVDQNRREIHLRTTDARMVIIKYDPATVVYSRDQEIVVDSLRYGDLILVKVVKNSRGEQYADLIRVSS